MTHRTVISADGTAPFMMDVGRRPADLLPAGSHRVLDGHGHVVPADVLAPVVAEHLRG